MNVKKVCLLILFVSIILGVKAQSNFEKGYILDNAYKKTECFIRNTGTAESADKYEYKLTPKGDILSMSLAKISEFGIEGSLKCVRALILVDVSGNRIRKEEEAKKGPEWEEGHAYIKVLVDGESAKLYSYYTEGEEFFYFTKDTSTTISPLYYKEYSLEVTPNMVDKIIINNTFREQLAKNLPCGEQKKLSTIAYLKKPLIRYFEDYNKFNNSDYVSPDYTQHKKGKILIGLVAGTNRLGMKKTTSTAGEVFNFSEEYNFGGGIEAEYIFAFNNHKISVFTEPNYYSYNTDYVDYSLNESHYGSEIDFKAIEIPIGIKYYMYLNDNNRFFFKIAFVPNFVSNDSYLTYNSDYKWKFENASRLLFGVGYKYKKISCEFHFYSEQDINFSNEEIYRNGSICKQLSFTLGYTLFEF